MIDKILLAPYYLILKFRHFLYDKGIFRSTKSDVPTIGIGNITVGGTGKTPHTELTVRTLLSSGKYSNIAVLSRGYRRESKGFQQVLADSPASLSGDEPLQIKKNFPQITVAVDADRTEGCNFLVHPEQLDSSKRGKKCINREFPPADIIVLDDVLQHRSFNPDLSILLIDYHRPVEKDLLMPLGRLRDLRERTGVADMIIVSKCPSYMDEAQKMQWADSLGLTDFNTETCQGLGPQKAQTLLFTTLRYAQTKPVFPEADSRYIYAPRAIVMTGIANDSPLTAYVAGNHRIVKHFAFGDHHNFTASDIKSVCKAAQSEPTAVIVTTQKDSQRLLGMEKVPEILRKRLFQVPVEAIFLSEAEEAVFRAAVCGLSR